MKDGRISFVLYETGERFVMDAKQVPSADDLLNALDDSDKTHRAVAVHFYADNGRFEDGDTMPSFTARDVEYDGKILKGEAEAPRPLGKPAGTARDKADADLAKGIALMAISISRRPARRWTGRSPAARSSRRCRRWRSAGAAR